MNLIIFYPTICLCLSLKLELTIFLCLALCISDAKKSLLSVFNGGICHPKMAMVIDDRMKVWEDKDQPRVHVVSAYLPYYAPQAEACGCSCI
jgi:hypothetical protein